MNLPTKFAHPQQSWGGGVGFSFPRKKRYEGYSSTLLALRGGGLASNFKEKIAT